MKPKDIMLTWRSKAMCEKFFLLFLLFLLFLANLLPQDVRLTSQQTEDFKRLEEKMEKGCQYYLASFIISFSVQVKGANYLSFTFFLSINTPKKRDDGRFITMEDCVFCKDIIGSHIIHNMQKSKLIKVRTIFLKKINSSFLFSVLWKLLSIK